LGRSRARRAAGSERPADVEVDVDVGDVDAAPGGPDFAGASGDFLQRLWRFRTQFRHGRDTEKVLRAALRLGLEVFRAGAGCIATVRPRSEQARILFGVPADAPWDRTLLTGFLRGDRDRDKVRVPPDLMLARIRRRGRMWGVLAVRSPGATYRWDTRQALSAIGALANELIDQIDRERVREVRARVDRKVLEQSQPKHLFYEVLHGIRSLTEYDHSAALLTYDPALDALEVVAEQVAWQKAKGRNVGRKVPLTEPLRTLLRRGEVCGFDREGRSWIDWTETEATALAELLDYDRCRDRSTPPEGAILCAPLVARTGLLGALKVAALDGGAFSRYEVDLVAQFLPQAAVALQNARRAESLEQKVLIAERKHAMADLARGVSHDVNNALGVVLPLVQQLREDLARGELEPSVAAEDLREIEHSIQACRRIFGGMLNFARGLARNPSEVSLRQAVDGALAILQQGLERRGVRVVVALPEGLPTLFGVQADVQQLLLNLVSNAGDATVAGGSVAIRAAVAGEDDDLLELVVQDNGCGLTREQLARIQEPFFTTKADGHGLGLAICRSIVAQMRGHLRIESAPGAGTTVRVTFPLNPHDEPEA
jgi:signal transduction histidine kinase